MIAKDELRAVIRAVREGRGFSEGDVGIEQATNRILALEQPDVSIADYAMHVTCPYCGFTPGNPCRDLRTGEPFADHAHPSRIRAAAAAAHRQETKP